MIATDALTILSITTFSIPFSCRLMIFRIRWRHGKAEVLRLDDNSHGPGGGQCPVQDKLTEPVARTGSRSRAVPRRCFPEVTVTARWRRTGARMPFQVLATSSGRVATGSTRGGRTRG